MFVIKLALLPILFLTVALSAPHFSFGCDFRREKQPEPILNSKYTVTAEGGLCCPLHEEDSNCLSEEQIKCRCPHGLVLEPCRHCLTCGKGLGELCGGAYGKYGECGTDLECTADKLLFFDGVDISGQCVKKGKRGEWEECNGLQGNCSEGLTCENMAGVHQCINRSTEIKGVCMKDCKDRERKPVCGDDGRMYQNICYLRQMNCHGADSVVKQATENGKPSNNTCHKACPDLPPIPNGAAIYVNSGKVTEGSVARFQCDKGFDQYNEGIKYRFPDLICECTSRQCHWTYQHGSNEHSRKTWTTSDLPQCVSSRMKECEDSNNNKNDAA